MRLDERLEQIRKHLGRDADTGVLYGNAQQEIALRLFSDIGADNHLAHWCEFERIAYQIGQHLAHPARIATDALRHGCIDQATE